MKNITQQIAIFLGVVLVIMLTVEFQVKSNSMHQEENDRQRTEIKESNRIAKNDVTVHFN